jgi:hypothetical protein
LLTHSLWLIYVHVKIASLATAWLYAAPEASFRILVTCYLTDAPPLIKMLLPMYSLTHVVWRLLMLATAADVCGSRLSSTSW